MISVFKSSYLKSSASHNGNKCWDCHTILKRLQYLGIFVQPCRATMDDTQLATMVDSHDLRERRAAWW